MPIAWSELSRIDPTDFNIRTVPARLAARGDVWSDILSRKNDLSPLLGV
jgi:DNA primase